MRRWLFSLGLVALASGAMATEPETIEVTDHLMAVQNLADRKVYSVADSVQSVTGSAADLLGLIPSVEVDSDGMLSLRGDSKVVILLDGKPSAQFSGSNLGLALQQLPASEIDRILVMTNPPPQYTAEGAAGIINIITKKSGGGLSGTLQASAGPRDRSVSAATLSYGEGPVRISATAGFRQDSKERRTVENRTADDPVSLLPVATHEAIDESLRRQTPSIKGSFAVRFNEQQSLTLSASHRELTGHRVFGQQDASAPAGQPFDTLSYRQSNGHEWNMAGGQSVDFLQTFPRPGETLSVSYQRSVTRERERYDYANDVALPLPPAAPSFDNLRLDMDLVKNETTVDYGLPSGENLIVKTGYDFEDDANAFDYRGNDIDPLTGIATVNPAITNDFRYHQQINAAYASLQSVIESWTFLGGARVEKTDIDSQQIIGAERVAQRYWRVLPNLHVNDDLTDQTRLFFTLGRRITRPDPEDLNPLIDSQDIHNLRTGNPALLPQDTWSAELGYGSDGATLRYDATAYVRDSRDAVTMVTQIVSADVLLYRKENLPHSRSAGVEFTANGKILPSLSFGISGTLFYSEIDATALGASGLRSTVGLNSKANLDWRPTGGDAMQLSFSRSDRRLTPQGEIGAVNLVNLGIRHELSRALVAVVTVSDALNGQVLSRLLATPTLDDDYRRRQMGQIAYAGFVYNFGGANKGKDQGFDYDR